MRLDLDLSDAQYERLQSLAASDGMSIEEYVLGRVLQLTNVEQLKAFLEPRRAAAERGEVYDGPTAIDKLLAELNEQPEGHQGEQH
jgi:hypothetical protein